MVAVIDFVYNTNTILPVFSVHVTTKNSQRQECWGAVWGVVLLQETGHVQAKVIGPWKVVRVSTDPSNYL